MIYFFMIFFNVKNVFVVVVNNIINIFYVIIFDLVIIWILLWVIWFLIFKRKLLKKIGVNVCGKCIFVWCYNYFSIILIFIEIFENFFIVGYDVIVIIFSFFEKNIVYVLIYIFLILLFIIYYVLFFRIKYNNFDDLS